MHLLDPMFAAHLNPLAGCELECHGAFRSAEVAAPTSILGFPACVVSWLQGLT